VAICHSLLRVQYGIAGLLAFIKMQQINEETGTARSIMRRRVAPGETEEPVADALQSLMEGVSATSTPIKTENPNSKEDARAKLLVDEQDLAAKFMKSLFGVVYQVYSSSAGPAIKHKCLRAMLRMVYYASPHLLQVRDLNSL
jgi:E3 ubiquitin-protein ligase TRIP12